MSTIHNVKARRPAKQQRAGQLIEALEVLGGEEAMRLRTAILTQLKVIEDVTTGASGASTEASQLKKKSLAADKSFHQGVDGVVAIATLASSELGAKLPSRSTYAGIDDDAYADVIIKALDDAGERKLAAMVRKAKERRLHLARESQKASQTTAGGKAHDASIEMAQLVLLMSQAEVLIRRMAPPGSPVLDRIKHPARGGKTKANADKEKPAGGKRAKGPKGGAKTESPPGPNENAGPPPSAGSNPGGPSEGPTYTNGVHV